MPTFLSTDNWLTRRAAYALFGWGVDIDGPKVSQTNELVDHSKHYFVGFPVDWVLKKVADCGGTYGTLYLECTRTQRTVQYSTPYQATAAANAYFVPTAGIGYNPPNTVNDSSGYSGGDDHVYESFDYVYNDNLSAGGTPLYGVYYYTWNFDGSYTIDGPYFETSEQGTSGQAVAGNDGTQNTYATAWYDKMTPDDVMDGIGYTPSTVTTNAYFRKTGDPSWGNASTLIMGSATWDATYSLADSAIGTIPFTTIRWDQDWTATGKIEHHSVNCRWRYNPNSTEGCKYWDGVQVELKASYKKRAITKTDSSGVTLTFGTAVSGGSATQTVTLHDQYTDQYVGTAFDIPEEEGYAYVIDDVEVLSITLP